MLSTVKDRAISKGISANVQKIRKAIDGLNIKLKENGLSSIKVIWFKLISSLLDFGIKNIYNGTKEIKILKSVKATKCSDCRPTSHTISVARLKDL